MKFNGALGYVHTVESESRPGIFTEVTTERVCVGDLLRSSLRLEFDGKVNADYTLNNTVSIIYDEYTNNNIAYLRYVRLNNSKWNVTTIEFKPPRMLITIGGLYNG